MTKAPAGTQEEQAEVMSVEEFIGGIEETGSIFHCPLCLVECTQYGAGMHIDLQFTLQSGETLLSYDSTSPSRNFLMVSTSTP
jgi:hypothetical protein